MGSPVRMQIGTWVPPVIHNNHPTQHQFVPTQHMGYYVQHQNHFDHHSERLSNPHTFPQATSGSANLQSNQTPQTCCNGSPNRLPYITKASVRHTSPNIIPSTLFKAQHVETRNVNLNHDRQVLNTTMNSMQNVSCTDPRFCVLSSRGNANGVFENSYCTYGSIPHWCHPLNRQHHGVPATYQPAAQSQKNCMTARLSHAAPTINMNPRQVNVTGQHNETLSSAAHFQAASEIPVDSFQPSEFQSYGSHMSLCSVKNALHKPSPCKEYVDYVQLKQRQRPPPSYRFRLNSALQNQANQMLNQVSPSLTQDQIQSQTTPVSIGHSKTDFASVSAVQSSMQPQDLRSKDKMKKMSTNSLNTTSVSRSSGQTSPISGNGSTENSHNTLLRLLLKKDNRELTDLISPNNFFGSRFGKSKSVSKQAIHDNRADCTTTGENYTQVKVQQGKGFQEPAKEMGLSSEDEPGTGSHHIEPQKSKQNEKTTCKTGNEEVQPCIDSDDSLKLATSPLRMVQQLSKAVAVVPPIYQQASSHEEQKDLTTNANDSLPSDTVRNLCDERKKMQKEANVPNVNFKYAEELPHVDSTPSLGSVSDNSVDVCEMPKSVNKQKCGSQRCDTSQCENSSVSTTQISNKCEDAINVAHLISRTSVEQKDDQEPLSSSEDLTFDLSTVPVVEYTLKKLKDLVKSLEVKRAKRDTSKTTDVVKSIIDLYYDGDKQNLIKVVASKELIKTSFDLFATELNDVVLRCPERKHLKMLENCSQILKNETSVPLIDFRSCWLNANGLPAVGDNVLEEPISDCSLTFCNNFSQLVPANVANVKDSPVQVATDNAEDLGMHACKDIPKTTTDGILEDIGHSDPENSAEKCATSDCKTEIITEKGCVSGTPHKLSITQSKAKKQFVEQLHNEENKQALRKPSLTTSPDTSEVLCDFGNTDISDDADSSSDLPKIIILSSEDAKKIFSDYFNCGQKRESNQTCQEERKDLVTDCVNQSDSSKVKPVSDLKFTCPHVNGLACGSDDFCPSCWNETPLLCLDQDEKLLSPVEGELKENGNLHSRASDICTPKSDGSDLMRDPNPGDKTQSSSPPPDQEQSHEIASTKNSSITKPVETKAKDLKEVDAESPLDTISILFPIKTSCNSLTTPITDANSIIFSPDTVIRNIATPNPLSVRRTTSSDGQHGYKRKKSGTFAVKKSLDELSFKTQMGTPSQMPVSGTPKSKNIVPHKRQKSCCKEKGYDGQSKETKKMRLELYGASRSREESPSTPVYLTISPNAYNGKRYTDNPTAKQKVYNQWSSTFVNTQKRSTSYKKRRKQLEDQLRSKIESLKIALEDKIIAIQRRKSSESPKSPMS